MSTVIYDLCIIGAGMYGSAAARHASANPRAKVCLIGPTEPKDSEKRDREIHSSHYDEGRIVINACRSQAMQVLAKHTIARFRELEKLSGIQFYYPVGCIVSSERNSEGFYVWRGIYDTSKVPYVDLSFGDTFRKRFPYLHLEDKDYPIFDDNGAGHASPRKLVEAEQRVAHLQGCEMVREVVETVSDPIDGLHLIETETGRVLKSKRVLFCTGAFTQFKNLTQVKNLKIVVNRETATLIKIDHDESKRLSEMPAMIVFKDGLGDTPSIYSGAYILPPIIYPDGHYYLKIGHMDYQKNSVLSTVEEVKDWYNNDKGDPAVVDEYSKFLFKIIPDLKAEAISSKTCVTCTNPTGLPYIDRITPTVTVAVVGNGRGAMVCEEVGRIAAILSLSGKWDSELSKSLFEVIQEEGGHPLLPNGKNSIV